MRKLSNGLQDVNILIVDDDQDTYQILSTFFSGRGYTTMVAGSGEEALKQIITCSPDVMILDIMMPGMDGWETYERVHEISDIPVLFLTALTSGETAMKALRLGAQDYVRKPFSLEELLARVDALLPKAKRSNSTVKNDQFPFGAYRPTVSVVIPTLNEAENLPLVLPYLPMDWIDEVILVDGRSKDGTVDVARSLLPSIKIVLETKPGKGVAMRAGFAAATGDIIVTLDADGSNDPREIPRMVQCLMEGADFVKGSRFTVGGGTNDMPHFRKLGNWALGTAVNLLFNGSYSDLCYGFHAFHRHCLEIINSAQVDGFEIDTVIYVRVLQSHLRIKEVPSFEGYRFYGKGKLQTIPDGWRILKTILREWVLFNNEKPAPVYLGFRGYSPIKNRAFISNPIRAMPQLDRIEMLNTIMEEIAAQIGLDHCMRHLLKFVVDHFGTSTGSILVLNENNEVVEGVLAYGGQVFSNSCFGLSMVVAEGLAGWVIKHRHAALLPNTIRDPRWLRRPWEVDGIVRSVISVPLLKRDRVFGVMTLAYPQPGQFTQDDLALLSSISVCASEFLATQQMGRVESSQRIISKRKGIP